MFSILPVTLDRHVLAFHNYSHFTFKSMCDICDLRSRRNFIFKTVPNLAYDIQVSIIFRYIAYHNLVGGLSIDTNKSVSRAVFIMKKEMKEHTALLPGCNQKYIRVCMVMVLKGSF